LPNLEVKCYSGHTYAEEPRSFTRGGVKYEVTSVEKRWREPGKRCFLVRAGGHKRFKLCYNEKNQQWSMTDAGGLK